MTSLTLTVTLLAANTSFAVGWVIGELLMLVGIPYLLWRLGGRFRVPRGLMIVLVLVVALFMLVATAVGKNSSASPSAGPIPTASTAAR